MKIEQFALLILFVISLRCYANEGTFGIAASTESGVCASFEKSVPIGSSIKVIETELPQYFVEATLEKEIENCAPLQTANIKGPYFAISVPEKMKVPLLGLAVYSSTEITKSINQVSLGTESTNRVYFRSCASGEGIHLSAWLGEPIKGKRLWHLYYYLGYDLEPNCEETEFTS